MSPAMKSAGTKTFMESAPSQAAAYALRYCCNIAWFFCNLDASADWFSGAIGAADHNLARLCMRAMSLLAVAGANPTAGGCSIRAYKITGKEYGLSVTAIEE